LHSFKLRVFKPVIFVFQGKNIAKLIKLIEISGIFSKLTLIPISPFGYSTPGHSLLSFQDNSPCPLSGERIVFSIHQAFKIVFSQLLSQINQKYFFRISRYL
jgi:hypothetical protein